MKKLAPIAIAAIAAVAVVVYFGHSSKTLAPASKPRQPPTSTHAPATEPAPTQRQAVVIASGRGPPQTLTRNGEPSLAAAGAQHASTNRERSAAVVAPLTDEQRQQAACDAMSDAMVARQRKREEAASAARAAETKDPTWAYAMEQKLHEYLSRRFQGSRVQVMEVDCKATFCDVRAESLGTDTDEEFDNVIATVKGESWDDFTAISLSHMEDPGKMLYSAKLSRAKLVHEQVDPACDALSARRAQQQRAARDAEPKDPSWAGPMEQLLRQHLTAQLLKYRMYSLDVSCRTTFCKISASGTHESRKAFENAVQQATMEPWSDLHGGSEGQGATRDDSWGFEYTVFRSNSP